MICSGVARNMIKVHVNCCKFSQVESIVADIKHLRPDINDRLIRQSHSSTRFCENVLLRLGMSLNRNFHSNAASTIKPMKFNQPLCLSTIQAYSNVEQRRCKHSKKTTKRPEYDSDSDSDSDDEEVSSQGAKILTIRVQSLRLDGLLKKAFSIARNKVETSFYEGSIRVNGKKPNKKSFQLKLGDEVDLIQGLSPLNPEFLSISRVEVMSVKEDDKDEDVDKLLVKVKRFKKLYIENYESAPWKKSSSSEETS